MKQGEGKRPYTILTAITPDDEEKTIWPVMARPDQRNGMLITQEPGDGDDIIMIPVKHVELLYGSKKLLKEDLKAELYITRSRVALACKNYDKGAKASSEMFWLGSGLGLTTALISKTYHKLRSRGSILAGHIRYEWLASVGGRPKVVLLGEGMRFGCEAGLPWASRSLKLEVWYKVPPGPGALATAAEVIRRAAAFKLNSGSDSEDATGEKLTKLTQTPPLERSTTIGEYTEVSMPVFTYVPG